MGDIQPVLVLVALEHNIQSIGGVGLLPLGDEYQVLRVFGMQLHITFLYVLLEGRVYFDYPSR